MSRDQEAAVSARCDACKRELHPVWGATTAPEWQLTGAAWVEVHGGYGMAIDNVTAQLDGRPDLHILLCAGCLRSAMSHLGLMDRLHA